VHTGTRAGETPNLKPSSGEGGSQDGSGRRPIYVLNSPNPLKNFTRLKFPFIYFLKTKRLKE
jgi:hypothetical protein